jgi:integrase/recombinase XerD
MDRFEQFTKEREYLMNVSHHTLRWYRHALKWMPSESPTESELKQMVVRMREAGLKPTGCNAACRAINAYLKWAGSPLKIPKLKEPEFIPPVFTEAQAQKIICMKPGNFCQQRMHVLALLLFDTGARISEALGLRWSDVDWGNLLLTLHGKGRKDRIVPMSLELRKALWKFQQGKENGWAFAARDGSQIGRCAALRQMKLLCRRLGFEPPARTLHAFRHTFAVNYIRRGGSVFHLQKMLGHSSLEMSRRYSNLGTEDLTRMHQSTSLLAFTRL